MRHGMKMSLAAAAFAAVAMAQPAPAPAPAPPAAPKAPAAAAPRARVEKRVIVKDGKVYHSENGGPLVRMKGRGYLGIHAIDMTDELRVHFHAEKGAGVLVGSVVDGSPAAQAGLKVGDVIIEIDDQKIDSPWDVTRAIRKKKTGDSIKVEFVRNGAKQQAFAKAEEKERHVIELGDLEHLEMPIPPIPPVDIEIDEEAIREGMRGATEYFNSPEWRAKMEKISECGQLQEKMRRLERKMQELEKKLK